jgi:hypothetical protein
MAALATKRGLSMTHRQKYSYEDLGYDENDYSVIYGLTRQMLTAQDLIQLWLRQEIDDNQLQAKLRELTISDSDIVILKRLAYFIPGVQDLIRMAVREAFTPEIAEKFGQYQDYPEAVTEWANKQGLSEEWAKRYWAAHWELPSPQMAFEMFQRKVISQDELQLLLRALDIMPYWRDKLTQIAYQPITRVDIRRMHKMGLISDSELTARYEIIGYSPEDAKGLAQFTIELNREEVKLEKQPERDLTASEILSAYANVYIDESNARSLLSGLGYDENEIGLKLALAELPAIKRVKTKEIEIIRQRYLYQAIDLNGAVDELNKLDLPAFELEYQLLDFQQDMELQLLKQGVKSAKQQSS